MKVYKQASLFQESPYRAKPRPYSANVAISPDLDLIITQPGTQKGHRDRELRTSVSDGSPLQQQRDMIL